MHPVPANWGPKVTMPDLSFTALMAYQRLYIEQSGEVSVAEVVYMRPWNGGRPPKMQIQQQSTNQEVLNIGLGRCQILQKSETICLEAVGMRACLIICKGYMMSAGNPMDPTMKARRNRSPTCSKHKA